MEDFYKFICSQIFETPYSLTINNGNIVLTLNGKTYTEKIFYPDDDFNIEDIDFLLNLSATVQNQKHYSDVTNKNVLKCWFLITHEKYFKKNFVTDKHGRIGADNLLEPFHKILSVPIADILRYRINEYFGLKTNNKPLTFLTCDFDTLDIWDTQGIIFLLKELLRSAFHLNIQKFFHTFFSFFFSRYFTFFNGYLNQKMFLFNHQNIENLGFFITHHTNLLYDGKTNYNRKTILNFIHNLQANNVKPGLHTNYNTMDNPDDIHVQKENFFNIFNSYPKYNRHHYLRFRFPEYLEILEKINIEKDFSLYFPENTLFRAGICSEYKVWNITENRPYSISVIPITLMDGTFTDYLNCNYETAKDLCTKKLDLAYKYGKTIVLLWHNTSSFEYSRPHNYHPKLLKYLHDYIKKVYNDTPQNI